MRDEKIKILLEEYLLGNLSTEGKNDLCALLSDTQNVEELSNLMQKDFLEDRFLIEGNAEIQHAIQQFLNTEINKVSKPSGTVIYFGRMVAAASILLFLMSALWLLVFKNTGNSTAPPVIASKTSVVHDITPGKTGAILTLADGRKIVLDDTQGSLAVQGSANVVNKNGQLSYSSTNGAGAIVYNTMSTPIGRQYQLVLEDGTKVWLNASSSITYPTAFTGKTRQVNITGEAYFEVMHNASKPFHVSVNGTDIQVLGTHFNINSYSNELAIKTTLLQGSIKVSKGHSTALIAPGQQAVTIASSDKIIINKDLDIDQVIAWKNGKFIFQDADIKSIMRQLERWYGVNTVYDNKVTDEEFIGVVSRNVNISQILDMLSKIGKVNFEINNKTIIVK